MHHNLVNDKKKSVFRTFFDRVIAIKGLKSGSTTATVIITNSDDTIESNITYYFEVNKDLKVKLVKTQYGKSK